MIIIHYFNPTTSNETQWICALKSLPGPKPKYPGIFSIKIAYLIFET